MENIKEQIKNLFINKYLKGGHTTPFINALIENATPEETKELALKEIDLIAEFVRLEHGYGKYWKTKHSRLSYIVYLQNKKIQKNDKN